MKTSLKYLLLLPLLGCGITVHHQVSGSATLNVDLEPKALMDSFTASCEAENAVDVNLCVDSKLGSFFRDLVNTQ